jgi:hypothetical protein
MDKVHKPITTQFSRRLYIRTAVGVTALFVVQWKYTAARHNILNDFKLMFSNTDNVLRPRRAIIRYQ